MRVCLLWSAFAPIVTLAAQQPLPPGTAEDESQPGILTPGRKSIERDLKGGDKQTYQVRADSGQFLHVVVEQLGIHVKLTLYGPDGKPTASMDSPNESSGLEQISTISEVPGDYRVEVASIDKDARAGRYSVKINPLRPASDVDIKRIAAERGFVAAMDLRREGNAESLRGAMQEYLSILPLWRTVGDVYEEAETLTTLGSLEYSLGERQKALAYMIQSVPLERTAGDRSGEEITLNNIGTLYADLGEKQKALSYLNQALPIERALMDRAGEVATLFSIGVVHSDLGETQKALEYFNQTLPLERSAGDRFMEVRTLNSIGLVYSHLGEEQKALDYYKQATPLERELGDRSGEATTLNNIGIAYSALGDKQKAMDYYNQALPLEQTMEDRSAKESTLNNIGSLYSDLGDNQKAMDYYYQALPLERALGDRSGEATTLNNVGRAYFNLGENQRALDHFNQALLMGRAVEDRYVEASILTNMGTLYFHLDEHQKALEYFNQALPLERAIGDRSGEATTLNNVCLVYSYVGDKQKALDCYNQALALERAAGERLMKANILENIGMVYRNLNQKQKALDYYNDALSEYRAGGDRLAEASTLNNIGQVHSDLGESQKAVEFYDRALPMVRALKNRYGEAAILGNLESVLHSSNPELAILFGKQAVNVQQSVRRDNKGLDQSLRSSFESSIEGYYRGLADLLVERERFGEAEEVLDLLKDKEASDFIRRDSVSDQLHSATLLDPEKKALARYDQIVDQIGDLGQKKAALLTKADKGQLTPAELVEEGRVDHDLNAANSVLEKFLNEEEKALTPASAAARRVGDLKEAEGLQDALARLGPDVVAIYTLVTPDKYVALLVTPGARKAYTSPIKEADLNKKVFEFREQLQNPGSNPRPLARELYGIVFPEGLRHDLDAMHAKTIMWSIDSTLRYIPFAALYDGRDYLVQSFRQSLITPASIPYLTEEPLKQWSGIGFGVSDGSGGASPLPSVPGELHGIFRETAKSDSPIPGVVLLNEAFTHQSFDDDLRKKRNPVVHIATHFASRPGVAANSELLLGDGLLSLAVIESETRLFNGVDLLTLSACNTAFTNQNQSEDGREVDSFGTIAQRLGAKGVIASLWSVNDDSTAKLMETMYRLREATPGLAKVEALRQAQLALSSGSVKPESMRGEPDRRGILAVSAITVKRASDWSHPYYWAPFILIGNWR